MPTDYRALSRRLTVHLFALSSLCWWGCGLAFSGLWWLTNAHQLAWIVFCYAWEVPVIGWSGAVLLPMLRWHAIGRALASGEPNSVRRLSCYPCFVGIGALVTSTVGYTIGALQLIAFAHVPYLEDAKIVVQGVLLGALLGLAMFLETERTARAVMLSARVRALAAAEPIRYWLAQKIRYVTITIALGAALPILLFGLTLEQRRLEEARGAALVQALAVATPSNRPQAMPAFGTHTVLYSMTPALPTVDAGVPVPIGAPRRATVVRLGVMTLDAPDTLFNATSGWFASRFDQHRVVAFHRRHGVLLLAVSPLSDYSAGLVRASETAGGLCAVALTIAFLIAFGFARNLVDPLQRLQRAAGAMATGQREVEPVAAIGNDEVTALTREFDAMAARVRLDEASLRAAHDQLVQSEKLSAVGRVVSGIAHELNNPLAAILHFAENLLSEERHTPDDREMLQSVATQARRARAIVRDLLSFVRARAQVQEAADIADVVRHAVDAVTPVVAETGASVSVSLEAESVPLVRIDAVGIEQVLSNLIVNAAQAAGEDGIVEAAVVVVGDRVRLSVTDSGPGIPDDVRPRIFEPFFTTKGPGKGTGLGLSVSLGIVQQHGGHLTVENRLGGGARFAFDVPVHPDQAEAREELRQRAEREIGTASVARAKHETVMVIDDEQPIRKALRLYLERSGWRVEEADSGRAALAMLLTAPPNRYRAVITDLTMPDVTGIQLHDTLAARRPDLCARLIIATGETVSDTVVSFRARSGRPFLEKPFELEALSALLERMP